MNSRLNTEYDLTGNYLNRTKIEKAPEGFTERVMMQITMEKVPSMKTARSRNEMIVGIAAVVIPVALIIIAVFTTSAESLFFKSVSQGLDGINNILPDFRAGEIPRFTLPGIIFYISAAILLLSLFDLALNRIFHRKS